MGIAAYLCIPHFLTQGQRHRQRSIGSLRMGPGHLKIGDIRQGSEGEGDVEDHAVTQEAITSWPQVWVTLLVLPVRHPSDVRL